MPKYRKKPVVIEAEQYTEYGKLVKGMCNSQSCYAEGNNKPHVHTIHNNQIVNLEVGDWIIPEPDGIHYYPCKPDIFDNTYEKVDEECDILFREKNFGVNYFGIGLEFYKICRGNNISSEKGIYIFHKLFIGPPYPTEEGVITNGEYGKTFKAQLEHLINRHSKENGSNTPDYILADFLNDCLEAYDKSVSSRDKWFGVDVWADDKKIKSE